MNKSFLDDIGYLYNNITTQDNQILNEESEYYNEEFAELVENIISTISYSMISEGCSASSVIDFLANAPEQEILEYYLNCNFSEGVVSEEYIEEQLIILEGGWSLLGKAAMAGLKNAGRVTKIAAQRMAGPGVRKAIGGAVTKAKDIAKGVKASLPAVAKGAGVLALGGAGGFIGAKMAGAGSEAPTAKGTPSGGAVKDLAAYNAGGGGAKSKKAGMAAADVENLGRSNLFKAGGGDAKMKKAGLTKQQVMDLGSKNTATKKPAVKPASTPSGGSGSGGGSSPSTAAKPTKPAAPAKPAAKGPAIGTTKGGTKYEIRTPDAREMAASKAAGGGEEGVKAAVAASQPTTGPTNAKVDTKAADAALAAENERLKKGTKPTTQKESYDAYDLVLNYLFETGQVDTISEAHYIMMELNADAIGGIVEKYSTFGYNADDPGDDFEQFVDRGPKTNKQKRNGIQLNNKILSKPGMPIKGV